MAKVEPDGEGGDGLSIFHPDHLGTALYITDESGAITWSGDCFPFGAEYSSTGTPGRYRFTQHELDPDTALVYAKARYYHPTIGRFISTDPVGGAIGSSQSWNRYSYVRNRPTFGIDPDGRIGPMGSGYDDMLVRYQLIDAVGENQAARIMADSVVLRNKIVGTALVLLITRGMATPEVTAAWGFSDSSEQGRQPTPAESPGDQDGSIYRVPGEGTQSGKPYYWPP